MVAGLAFFDEQEESKQLNNLYYQQRVGLIGIFDVVNPFPSKGFPIDE